MTAKCGTFLSDVVFLQVSQIPTAEGPAHAIGVVPGFVVKR